MKKSQAGYDDPCGSGKSYGSCCGRKEETPAPENGTSEALTTLREALEGKQFESMGEAQRFVERHTRDRNRRPLEPFGGLSPGQMHRLLYFPFTSPELVHFPEVLDDEPSAPILTLFDLLSEAIGEKGLKTTAKGNLPRNFCREAALACHGEEGYRRMTKYGNINREEDFFNLHVTRLVAQMAGLVRKYKGRFILSRKARALLDKQGAAAIYPGLLRAYAEQFNWAYLDRSPEFRLIQTAFLFSLYLLQRHGEEWRPAEFYADAFLHAFPALLDEAPPIQYLTPDEMVRNCYISRTLFRFANFLGLARVEPVDDDPFCGKYRVQALPLLHRAVRFHLEEG